MSVFTSTGQEIVTSEERLALITPQGVNVGPYWPLRATQPCEFVVEVDARPLLVLFLEAARGRRVYELMSIRRPGEVLHYLRLGYRMVEQEVIDYIVAARRDRHPFASYGPEDVDSLPFLEFDEYCRVTGDDARPFQEAWFEHRQQASWIEKTTHLLAMVKVVQGRLRARDDALLQNEIQRLDQEQHIRDYWPDVERLADLEALAPADSSLPDGLLGLIAELIQRDDVRSVSCCLDDYRLWQLLVEEQLRRAQRLGLPPREAFQLSGPDSGLPTVPAEDWGGEIHIPYEGIADGDLFFLPGWRRFHAEAAGVGGNLGWAVGKSCKYVLTQRDFGELGCASRLVCGNWVLYSPAVGQQ